MLPFWSSDVLGLLRRSFIGVEQHLGLAILL